VDIKNTIYNRNPLMVLSYLSKSKNHVYGSRIASDIGINQGSVSLILKFFEGMGIIKGEETGKTILYSADSDNPIIKAFRVFENLIEINPLVQRIKSLSRKIVLFGSCASGSDNAESDMDIFIVADKENKSKIIEQISNFDAAREINPVIVDVYELMDMDKDDKAFLDEVGKGIILWDGGEDE